MRKNILMTLACLLLALTAMAQSNSERVAEIRKMYAQAKKNTAAAEKNEKAGKPSNITVALSNYNLTDGTPGKVATHYYYEATEIEETDRVVFQPYFITNKYDVGSYKYYQEFLFDSDGNLAFYYELNDGNETRFYYAKNGEDTNEGIVHEINSNGRTIEPPFANSIASALTMAFNLLMNREF